MAVGSDSDLSIDALTGEVTLNSDPVHDVKSQYNFIVVATDEAGNESAGQSVSLNIIKVVDLNENSGANQIIYTASADGLTDGITFSLASDTDSSVSIDATSGEVSLTADPDHETQSVYNFTVIATDTDGNQAAEKLVFLRIIDLDDVAPLITSADTFFIDENTTGKVYDVVVDDSGDDIQDEVYYGFLDDLGNAVAALDIEDGPSLTINGSGEITLSGTLDYEVNESISFTLLATNDKDFLEEGTVNTKLGSVKQIVLTVNNIDDTAPIFRDTDGDELENFALSIDENIASQQPIYTAVADDSIDGDNDTLTYSIVGDDADKFSIDDSTGDLTLTSAADFEDQNNYSLNIVATDAAGNVSDALALLVTINNLDEVAPSITSDETVADLDENSGYGQVIYTVTANDSSDFSEGVSFSLSDDSDPALSIEPSSGEVTLLPNPDFENQSEYNFAVIATDAAGNSSLPKPLTLKISDVDDTPPIITSGASAETIPENSGAGQVIYTAVSNEGGGTVASTSPTESLVTVPELAADTQHVYVSESTKSEDGSQVTVKLSYLVDDSTLTGVGFDLEFDTNVLSLDSVSGVASGAVASGSLNADGDALVFAWSDPFGGSWPGSTEAELATITFNVIDNAAGSTALDIVKVSTPPGYAFDGQSHEVVISDPDALENVSSSSVITFSLTEDSDPALTIDQASGEVSLLADADFETQSKYNFGVIAIDAAGNVSEVQPVTLNIENLDEVAPVITSSGDAAVLQGAAPGTKVYQITADDSADVSSGAGFTFGLSGADAPEFEIDANSGEVTLKAAPDVDASREYNFDVIATDDAGNQSEAKSVVLSIIAQDLVAPVFTSPDSAVAIDENSGSGQVVYTATTTDETVVTYNLAGDDADKFSIGSSNGEVVLIEDPDYESQSEYSFDIIATDSSGNISDPKTVTLVINNLDEAAPTITSDASADAIDENTGVGQVIYTATVDDSADITDNEVTFSLSENSDIELSIDPESGEVTLLVDPNYEPVNDYTAAKNEYTFTVIATDTAGNASTGEPITLTINNVDDAPPTITSNDTADSIDSLSGGDQVVYIATADDSDDISDGVTFSLAGPDAADFKINDPSSGEIILANNPNYSIKSEYNFDVIATDAAGNTSEAKSVILKIDDLAPFAATVSLSEDTGLAEDNISSNGELTVSGLKFGAQWEYSLDNGLSWNLGSTSANSDNASINFYSVSVEVDGAEYGDVINYSLPSSVDQVVYTAKAEDFTDVSGEVSFSLRSVDPELSIDPALNIDISTGVVTLSNDPGFQAQLEYNFLVVATDISGNESEGQSVTVGVNNLEGDYQVIIRQTNNSIDSQTGEPRSSDSEMVEFTVDTSAPEVQLISADSATGIITISYDEALDVTSTPNSGDYVVTQGGNDLIVSNVEVSTVNPLDLLLTIDSGLSSGALRVEYIPSDSLIQDIAGNESSDGFNSMIVSDGYIGAEVYVDRNENGVADSEELLEGYTTDEFGQLILPDSVLNAEENLDKQLIIQGGINMDTGAPNEIELKAPVGYDVINPLSTLVATVVDSGVDLADAESKLAEAFGIELDGDSGLGSYDPLSDTSDSALENRVIVTQIATVLAVASAASDSSSDDEVDAEAAALSNLANIVTDQDRVGSVTLDSEQLTEILSVEGESLVEADDLDSVVGAVSDMTEVLEDVKEAKEAGIEVDFEAQIEKVVRAQAEAIDNLAPNAPKLSLTPESDLGISTADGLTSDTTPTVLIRFDTFSNDGRAVVVGDTVEVFNSGRLLEEYVLTKNDIKNLLPLICLI